MAKVLTDVLELSNVIVSESTAKDATFIDKGMLMYMAQMNTYGSEDDAISDGNTPARVKVQFHVYIERLD